MLINSDFFKYLWIVSTKNAQATQNCDCTVYNVS